MAGSVTLTILSGQQVSNEFPIAQGGARQAMALAFLTPADLVETVNIQIAGPLGHFCSVRSNGTVIALNAADIADQVVILCAERLRLRSTAPVGGDRTFEVLWNVKPGV